MKRLYIYVTILYMLFSSIPLSVNAQTKRALVIGIGEQLDPSWGKINGDKDVPLVLELLKESGFNKKNIVKLINSQATKYNIVKSFKDLAKIAKINDIIYVHFSGHGQRVTDVNGDESDGWDEAWIPYDAYRKYCDHDKGEKHLIDDEIYLYLSDIKKKIGNKGKILVVVDACHSGTSSYENELFDIDAKPTTRGVMDNFFLPTKTFSLSSKSPERWLTLSACKSFQYNQELNNPRVGILTYAIYMLHKKGRVTIKEIEDYVKLNKGPLPQTPILTGEVNKYKISDILTK